MSFSIKLNLSGEYRRVVLNRNDSIKEWFSYSDLSNSAYGIYPQLKDKVIRFSWLDEEGDKITFSSDNELLAALASMKDEGKNVFKFDINIEVQQAEVSVVEPVKTEQSSKVGETSSNDGVYHPYITCDECGQTPIVGIRYKCAVRNDFDLCGACESQKTQPYPMIKIYHPDQNPASIIVTLRDTPNENFRAGRGCRNGFRGFRGPHHAKRFGCPPFPVPNESNLASNEGCNTNTTTTQPPLNSSQIPVPVHGPFSANRICPQGPHHGRRWARGMFVNAMDERAAEQIAATTTTSNTEVKVENQNNSQADDEADQKILEEVMRVSAEEALVQEALTHPSKYLKARFVKDITFPDGSVIQPGTVFNKIWRVRNDGSIDWFDGTVIVSASSDDLVRDDFIAPIESLKAGMEGEITVQLTAPQSSGRHIAYFRLQTKDGANFGQRLWADIRVNEDEAGWQVLSGIHLSNQEQDLQSAVSESLESNHSNESTPSVTVTETEENVNVGITSEQIQLEDIPVVTVPVVNGSIALNAPFVEDVVDSTESQISQMTEQTNVSTVPITTHPTNTIDMANQIWARVYETEIKILRDMGFMDLGIIIPLLREYITVPVSQNSELNGQPNPENMQRLVMDLLGSSTAAR